MCRVHCSRVLQGFSWLTAHLPGNNAGHPVGLGLFEQDIAILRLQEPAALECREQQVWPACLPRPGQDYAHWPGAGLAGWGQTRNTGNISQALLTVNTPIVSDRTCQERVRLPPPT